MQDFFIWRYMTAIISCTTCFETHPFLFSSTWREIVSRWYIWDLFYVNLLTLWSIDLYNYKKHKSSNTRQLWYHKCILRSLMATDVKPNITNSQVHSGLTLMSVILLWTPGWQTLPCLFCQVVYVIGPNSTHIVWISQLQNTGSGYVLPLDAILWHGVYLNLELTKINTFKIVNSKWVLKGIRSSIGCLCFFTYYWSCWLYNTRKLSDNSTILLQHLEQYLSFSSVTIETSDMLMDGLPGQWFPELWKGIRPQRSCWQSARR